MDGADQSQDRTAMTSQEQETRHQIFTAQMRENSKQRSRDADWTTILPAANSSTSLASFFFHHHLDIWMGFPSETVQSGILILTLHCSRETAGEKRPRPLPLYQPGLSRRRRHVRPRGNANRRRKTPTPPGGQNEVTSGHVTNTLGHPDQKLWPITAWPIF